LNVANGIGLGRCANKNEKSQGKQGDQKLHLDLLKATV
jgi:hypothetical protein